jgi:glycosyltransferase involved in cell wall biosynthesis
MTATHSAEPSLSTIRRSTPLLLSVIVPTRERAETLAFTLATVLEQSSQDYEVIVSDNASTDETRAVVNRVADPRVHYFNTGQRLSMCGNYEYALERARGDYVIFIGDDDAVIPGAIDYLLSLVRGIPEKTIHMWPLHTYDWPVAGKKGRVAYLAPARTPSELDLKALARFVVGKGGWKYYELPSPYHAAIPRHLLNKIRLRTGRVFHSTQPDVFTAMALPALAYRAINIGTSITFNGRSSRSNGLGFVKKSAQLNIDRFLGEYGDYKIHSSLFKGVSTAANMIPDAILLARDLFPEVYDGVDFNYEAMWAFSCRHRFVSHLNVLRNIKGIREKHSFRVSKFILYSLIHEISVARRKLLNLFMPTRHFEKDAQNNIFEFARALASNPERPTERRRRAQSR